MAIGAITISSKLLHLKGISIKMTRALCHLKYINRGRCHNREAPSFSRHKLFKIVTTMTRAQCQKQKPHHPLCHPSSKPTSSRGDLFSPVASIEASLSKPGYLLIGCQTCNRASVAQVTTAGARCRRPSRLKGKSSYRASILHPW